MKHDHMYLKFVFVTFWTRYFSAEASVNCVPFNNIKLNFLGVEEDIDELGEKLWEDSKLRDRCNIEEVNFLEPPPLLKKECLNIIWMKSPFLFERKSGVISDLSFAVINHAFNANKDGIMTRVHFYDFD